MKISYLRILISSLLICCVFLTACGSVGDTVTSDTGTAEAVFKVALLLPGPIDDTGWSQAGYEGLKKIETELGAEIAHSANTPEDETEQAEILRQYAKDGYHFIMGHGGEYVTAMEIVATEFPQTHFAAITSYSGNNKNMGGLGTRADEAGYLGGVTAGLKTTTNKVAYIGGQEFAATLEESRAFEKAVNDVNPDAEVVITWVDSWSDQEKAYEVALAQIEAGADVLAVDADIAGLAVLELAEERGVHVIGWVQDQHELAPNAVVTSVLQKMDILLLQGAILVQQGRWEGKQYKLGLQERVIDLSPLYGDWTPEQKAIIKQVKEDIIASKIDILP